MQCDGCDRSTLELCSRDCCYYCCNQLHDNYDCDKYEGEWKKRKGLDDV